MAAATENIGFGVTVATTYEQVFQRRETVRHRDMGALLTLLSRIILPDV